MKVAQSNGGTKRATDKNEAPNLESVTDGRRVIDEVVWILRTLKDS